MSPGRLVVVGGGVIGASVAWRAAGSGWSVTLVDPAPGSGASWVAGGMLAPAAEVIAGEDAVARLGVASAERYPAFVEELAADGGDAGYARQGTLVVARDADDLGELTALADLQGRLGLAAERVSSRQARRLEPALGAGVRGALWLEGDHQVDNRMLLAALGRAGAARGVVVEPQAATVVRSGPAGHEVALADGRRLAADDVVVATGADSGRSPVLAVDGAAVVLPVRPVKGQIVRLQATDAAVCPTRTVRGVEVYVVPRGHGEVVVGATSEERGFDTTVTAGAVRELLDRAWELLPGLAEARFVEVAAGLRPGTPDNAPLLGRLPGGPLVATGHHRHGVLLAPVTAAVVVGMLDGGAAAWPPGLDPAAFAPDRFASDRVASDRVASGGSTPASQGAEVATCS